MPLHVDDRTHVCQHTLQELEQNNNDISYAFFHCLNYIYDYTKEIPCFI